MKSIKRFDYKGNPAWRMFRIMGEFTEGFEFISELDKAVTVFGSARFDENSHWYKEAAKLGRLLTSKGCHVVTGGGPGIMEAANRGAFGKTPGDSVGLNIRLPREQRTNPYVEREMNFHYFFTRKICMTFSANAFVYFPGGFGTFDELFEIVTLVQTGKIEKVPIILVGKNFWIPFLKLIAQKMIREYETLTAAELRSLIVVDNAKEAFKVIMKAMKR